MMDCSPNAQKKRIKKLLNNFTAPKMLQKPWNTEILWIIDLMCLKSPIILHKRLKNSENLENE